MKTPKTSNNFITTKALIVGVLFALSTLLLSSCASANSKTTTDNGIWLMEDYGQLFEIKNESTITMYQITPTHCDKQGTGRLTQNQNGYNLLDGSPLLVGATHDERTFLDTMGYRVSVKRLSTLPEFCQTESSDRQSPITNFEAYWQIYNQHYAFFDLHNVDWQSQYNSYRPQVTENTTETELFRILSDMTQPLRDGHISISAKIDQKEHIYSPNPVPNWNRDELVDTIIGNLISPPELIAAESFAIAELNENTAYVNSIKMSGFSDTTNTMDIREDFATFNRLDTQAAHKAMQSIMQKINDSKYDNLVLDLRLNGGGTDNNSAVLASYFLDKERVVYTKSIWFKDRFSEGQAISISPNDDTRFTKAIMLLISEETASAAEFFVLMMRDLPNVTIIGENSAGELSDIFFRTLPNGWETGLSNQRHVSTDGFNFEGDGIVPDVYVAMTAEDINAGKDKVLEKALELLQKQ